MRVLMRRAGIIALSILLLALLAGTALAVTNFENAPSGTHFTKGNAEPVCTENEATNTVSCTGTQVAGVGNTNADISLVVEASAIVECHNPGSKDKVVEPHSTTLTDTETDVAFSAKNGRLTVDPISETITERDVETAFTCPNPNWREEVTDITITGFTYSVTFAGFEDPFILITG
jgi:hypothetical protein